MCDALHYGMVWLNADRDMMSFIDRLTLALIFNLDGVFIRLIDKHVGWVSASLPD